MPLLASPRLSLPSHLVFVDCPAAHNNMIDDLFAFWRCRICSRPAEHLQLREGRSTVLGRLRPTWTNVHECSVQLPPTGQCEHIPLCTVHWSFHCYSLSAFAPQLVPFLSLPVSEMPSDCHCGSPHPGGALQCFLLLYHLI